ncbi:hypothetical protein A3I25_01900 [Candidatus Nomurabacteria bacterium RIFCSPLOWO2_02_FULL_42_17]|uniref:DUF378 domain-containing protein n=1 Tax=Candidatus Nomurabacteria bacterium RIFCSPLOWO2_02_FULL_42_17 TaxID=1801789 RepID=A0A1F6XT12_9BACT|nr:MAG: hypothetical protein A3I25_01900 [Candidatus Nomurabacteria bacterium RIFCSPLOWO2_02_FULL_42_17]
MIKACHTIMGKIAMILSIIGGINWGLVGVGTLVGGGNWNVINAILGDWPMVEAIIYVLVGVSATWMIFGCRCAQCDVSSGAGM